ncbi:MAG: hypothetical protein ACREOI_03235 [bacterium]
MLRGGAWNNNPNNVACAYRNNNDADNRNNNVGFRCAKTPFRKTKSKRQKANLARPVFPESGGSRVAGARSNGCS